MSFVGSVIFSQTCMEWHQSSVPCAALKDEEKINLQYILVEETRKHDMKVVSFNLYEEPSNVFTGLSVKYVPFQILI